LSLDGTLSGLRYFQLGPFLGGLRVAGGVFFFGFFFFLCLFFFFVWFWFFGGWVIVASSLPSGRSCGRRRIP